MTKEIIQKRVTAIRHQLNKKNISCFLTTKASNVTYLTGFLGHDSWAVVAPGSVYLLTDSRYIEEAQKDCRGCKILQRIDTLHDTLAAMLKKYPSIRSVAVEDSILLKDFELLKKKARVRFYMVSKIVEPSRSIKDHTELAAIKKAIEISAKALKELLKSLRPGMTENEAAGFLDYQFRRFGGRNGFDTILAFGPNASRCHHQPGPTKLKANDTVLVDFGAEYEHYRCDMTRSFLVGRPNPFFEKVYNAVKEAQAAAIKLIKPGAPNKLMEKAARETICNYDLIPYQHGTGHGFGLEIHEDPFLAIKSKEKLLEGMVLTVEPGIYLPGQMGVRIEDNVIITKNGCKVLTTVVPKDYKSICLGDITKKR